MTYQISVCYGHPDDPAAFEEHYRSTHLPLLAKVPAVAAATYGRCRSLDGSATEFYAVAHIVFDTEEDLQRALASPEMRATGKDVRNFATGGATMYLQELETTR
ncbi:EthD family reductase [Nocardia sp. NEAU-G5]|uniref:EthD family reductase n=1 Tax=Nocardia albiluteola TaxID=2842303 RepID=A0ABS6AW61_9NOCA|nr:EthD family reductase [Nocardia albiluteola]MBU3062277.1 EthD family reductase [Nocardia albiluteola]